MQLCTLVDGVSFCLSCFAYEESHNIGLYDGFRRSPMTVTVKPGDFVHSVQFSRAVRRNRSQCLQVQ